MIPVERSNFDIITVHAPQPPSAQPSFVPVKFTKLFELRIFPHLRFKISEF